MSRTPLLGALAVTTILGLSGCGDENSYAAAESGLREWIAAVRGADRTACDLMTAAYRREFTKQNGAGDTDCAQVIEARPASTVTGLPPDDVEMVVAVWDPSGEARVETFDGHREQAFWMQYEDGRWRVAGTAT